MSLVFVSSMAGLDLPMAGYGGRGVTDSASSHQFSSYLLDESSDEALLARQSLIMAKVARIRQQQEAEYVGSCWRWLASMMASSGIV